MNKRTKAIIILSCALGATVPLAACTLNAAPYDDYGEIVKIVYHREGGTFSTSSGIEVCDSIPVSAFEAEGGSIRLIAPGSTERNSGSQSDYNSGVTTIGRAGYSLVGWYREREEHARVDENGNALDDCGERCLLSGKEQASVYSDKWDYDVGERLSLDECTPVLDGDGKPTGSYEFHLYAAWAPDFTYVFYRETTEEEKREAASRNESVGDWTEYGRSAVSSSDSTLAIPEWDVDTPAKGNEGDEDYVPAHEGTGELNFSVNFEKRDGYTLTAVYGDPQKKIVYADYTDYATDTALVKTVEHNGATVVENATTSNTVVSLYTTWQEGRTVKVNRAAQLRDAVSENGTYVLRSNLEFTAREPWPFGVMTFSGKIVGNNHTIEGISTTQSAITQIHCGGVFGEVTAEAEFENVTFENVAFLLGMGTSRPNGSYGLFAGVLSAEATLTNVTLTGTMTIGRGGVVELSQLYEGGIRANEYITAYNVGLVGGNGETGGIATDGIRCECFVTEYNGKNVKVYEIEVQEDFTVHIVKLAESDYIVVE